MSSDPQPDTVPPSQPPLSPVEGHKENSRGLRGTIALDLAGPAIGFSAADKNLLKFHGSYQQEDRDARQQRRKDGLGKHIMFMVRCKMPGGRLSAAQYLEMDRIAGIYGNGTVRFTSRQGIQFHGILKGDLKPTIAEINRALLSTLGACGDVNRNVMACPAPLADGLRAELQRVAGLLAEALAPRTHAYHEIWLNGKPLPADAPPAEEPLYGKTYLPRKFKTGLGLAEDNCIDIYAQDLGLLAIVDDGRIVGYNVLVGGGMGMTHGKPQTFPQLASPICYVPASDVVNAAEAVVRLFRDHGNRSDRKQARIKYLVHSWGVEKFRAVLAGYLSSPPQLPRPVEISGFHTHLGWHPQGNGRWYYGISIENGRVKDEGSLRLRSGLRAIAERFRAEMRVTAIQDLLICGLTEAEKPLLESLLAEHGVTPPEKLSPLRKYSLACPAIPTCGLALSEAERSLPTLIAALEVELKTLGLENETLAMRMTGCPNGCVRPYQSDIGIVGRSGDKYVLYVGGHVNGQRLNFELRDLVPRAQLIPTLRPLLRHFRDERQGTESFGDFCHRIGKAGLEAWLPAAAPISSKVNNGDDV